MIWVLGAGGWALAVLLLLVVRGRLELVADAEHELRGAAAAIGLAAERMGRVGATRPFASLVALQLDRMNAALTDLSRVRRRRPRAPRPGPGLDAGRLSQVVANLVDNATVHGAGPVDVRWTSTASGARLEIRNANRPKELEELAAARTSGRGRGLGIASRAAREIGGSLRIDSGEELTAATLDLPAPDSRSSRAA